ncbi:hypothetical protein D3C77_554650 [compost metagenome]
MAPDSEGSAASMNSCSVLKLKPTLFRRTVTVLHTIHTAKASSSAGTEIHRLRVAIFCPTLLQNCASSGRQSVITGPLGGCNAAIDRSRVDMVILLGRPGARTHPCP